MEHELIETLFDDPSEFVKFFVALRETGKASSDGNCIARLRKDTPQKWSYTLMLTDGRHIGDYLKPFKPSKENYAIFNEGCRELARRFRIYLETRDASQVPSDPPAFGPLTYVDGKEAQL